MGMQCQQDFLLAFHFHTTIYGFKEEQVCF